jgi:hypothetical protein
MKARYKIKIETGRKARELDERQAQVIRDLLAWARQHRARHPGRQGDSMTATATDIPQGPGRDRRAG